MAARLSRPLLFLSVVSAIFVSLSLTRSVAAQLDHCSVTLRIEPQSPETDFTAGCDGSIGNRTCHDLQTALLSLSRGDSPSPGDCTEVLVPSGNHTITEFIAISHHNLSLSGEAGGNVSVRFNFSGKFDPRRTSEPHYVLSFSNADSIRMTGIDFTDSPGIITVLNVSSVEIEECSFR